MVKKKFKLSFCTFCFTVNLILGQVLRATNCGSQTHDHKGVATFDVKLANYEAKEFLQLHNYKVSPNLQIDRLQIDNNIYI